MTISQGKFTDINDAATNVTDESKNCKSWSVDYDQSEIITDRDTNGGKETVTCVMSRPAQSEFSNIDLKISDKTYIYAGFNVWDFEGTDRLTGASSQRLEV